MKNKARLNIRRDSKMGKNSINNPTSNNSFSSLSVGLYTYFFRYPTPTNLSTFWNFGFLSFCFLLIQIISGFFLSMHYVPDVNEASNSVTQIMRSVEYGWLYRYIHMNGASFFFFLVYCHMGRSLYNNSFILNKANVWLIGIVIYLLMILTAFTGYVLPWGQMSFWAATVITNLTTSIPFIGFGVAEWIWGDFVVGNALLNRFYSFHYILPFIIFILSAAHVVVLHIKGSTNKLKVIVSSDKMQFSIYYLMKDLTSLLIVLIVFSFVIAYCPNLLSHYENYVEANPMSTPEHIEPEWYFLVFYAILRSVPDKLSGVLLMAMAIVSLGAFPFLVKERFIFSFVQKWDNICEDYYLLKKKIAEYKNGDKKKSITKEDLDKVSSFKDFYFFIWTNRLKFLFWIFVITVIVLGIVGSKPVETPYVNVGRVFTFIYFFYFPLLITFFKKNVLDTERKKQKIEEILAKENIEELKKRLGIIRKGASIFKKINFFKRKVVNDNK